MRCCVAAALVVTAAACGPKRPPMTFAPEPGLVEQIREIRMSTSTRACPGETFAAVYTAVLNDGSLIPFETRYNKNYPPRLHVMFLNRWSDEATPLESGGWTAWRDPLLSAMTGFRLNAELKARPSIKTAAVLTPDYSCLQHTFGFQGARAGASGPQVTVRLGIVQTPFYDRLLVAGLEVEDSPPYYVVGDARAVPPSDWLIVESRGARGYRGVDGGDGQAGTKGQDGCPGVSGGPGGTGGMGSQGGTGGSGGQLTIIVPSEEPFLAGLVEPRLQGGEGGPGGTGGKAGPGGKGGAADPPNDPRCVSGANGSAGAAGQDGSKGRNGSPGNRPQIVTVPMRDVFGMRIPPQLAELINYRPPPAPARR